MSESVLIMCVRAKAQLGVFVATRSVCESVRARCYAEKAKVVRWLEHCVRQRSTRVHRAACGMET